MTHCLVADATPMWRVFMVMWLTEDFFALPLPTASWQRFFSEHILLSDREPRETHALYYRPTAANTSLALSRPKRSRKLPCVSSIRLNRSSPVSSKRTESLPPIPMSSLHPSSKPPAPLANMDDPVLLIRTTLPVLSFAC
ncbi:hypothetical protein KCU74_g84, partial [Aureobasidium melanogenum]